MNFTSIKETCIYVRDLDSAIGFYRDKLGLPVVSHIEKKHVFFRAGNSMLLCFNPDASRLKGSPPAHYAEGRYHFAFEVQCVEYEEHKKRILDAGISIIDILKWHNGLESFYFNDPAGNVLEIVPEGVWG